MYGTVQMRIHGLPPVMLDLLYDSIELMMTEYAYLRPDPVMRLMPYLNGQGISSAVHDIQGLFRMLYEGYGSNHRFLKGRL